MNLSATCFALGAIVLGHTLQISNGFYDPSALAWLTCAFLLVLIGGLAHRWSNGTAGALVAVILAGGVALQLAVLLFNRSPLIYMAEGTSLAVFRALLIIEGLAIALGIAGVPTLRRLWFPAVLVVSLALGIWTIRTSPEPFIDVVEVHKEAIGALLKGSDPYRITFQNVYPPEMSRLFYNPAALAGNRVMFSYPYPPASLLFVVPGQVLFGDYRYAELALLVAAAAFIGWSRPGLSAKLAACLLLTTPRLWFVIEQGWTEPVGIFVLAATVYLLIRGSIPAGAAAGILVVTKQYLGFAALAVIRLAFYRPRDWRRTAAAGLLAAAAVTLPFVIKHPNAFFRNVVWLQTLEPFRMDSLSFVSWAARSGWGQGSYLWAVGAAAIVAALTIVTTRNSESGFAAAVSLTTFSLFVFGSKAFCNYYFFVIGALCSTVAAYPTEKISTPPTMPLRPLGGSSEAT